MEEQSECWEVVANVVHFEGGVVYSPQSEVTLMMEALYAFFLPKGLVASSMYNKRHSLSNTLQLYMAEHGPSYPWTVGKLFSQPWLLYYSSKLAYISGTF